MTPESTVCQATDDHSQTVPGSSVNATILDSGRVRARTVRANGLEFPIFEAGSGPLVLCLHGFSTTRATGCPCSIA